MGSRLTSTLLRVLPLIAALVSVGPLLVGGYPAGHDWIFELVRSAEFSHSLEGGQLPPYWADNLYGGLGSPIFQFYAPLFLALSSFWGWVTGAQTAGGCAALLLLAAVAATGMSWFCSGIVTGCDTSRKAAARVGAYLFVLNPYLIGNALLRNANAEFTALALAPVAFACLVRLKDNSLRYTALSALSLGALVIAHNLSALVYAVLWCVFALALYWRSSGVKIWLSCAASAAVALMLSAYFWLPALGMRGYVHLEWITLGKFDFHNQFQPLSSHFGYDFFYSAGLLPLVVFAAALAAARHWKELGDAAKRLLPVALVAAPLLVFVQHSWSTPLWESVPFMPLFQFPWRFMGPLALVTALAGGLAFSAYARRLGPRAVLLAELAVLSLCILNALPQLGDYLPLGDREQALVADLSPGQIRQLSLPATVMNEYLPQGAADGLWNRLNPDSGLVVHSTLPVKIFPSAVSGTDLNFVVESSAPTTVLLRRWAYPGWLAYVDGDQSPTEADRNGLLAVEVPEGRHEVRVHLEPPRIRRIGIALSLAALLAVLIMFICDRVGCPPSRP